MDGEYEMKQAYAAILESDFEQAIDWFERAIACDPHNASYRYRLSVTCARSGRLAKAIMHAGEAVQLDPHQEVYRHHAETLEAKKLVQEAERTLEDHQSDEAVIESLRAAIALDPLLVEARVLLAFASWQIGREDEALRALQDALKLDPQHPEARRLLDQIHLPNQQNR